MKNHNCCKQAFACDSEGFLMNCPYLRFLPRLGNALSDDLIEVWNCSGSVEICQTAEYIPEICSGCINVGECQGGCTAGRLLGIEKYSKDMICGREKIKYVRNHDIRVDLELGIKLFLYNPQNGKEYTANALAALIWEMLGTPKTEDEICVMFQKAGMTDKSEVINAVEKICGILLALSIISVSYNE